MQTNTFKFTTCSTSF